MAKDIQQKVKRQFDQDEIDKAEKRKKWEASDEQLQKLLGQLRNEETIVTVNPDKVTNSSAEEALRFIDKVMAFLEKDHYAAAETLLRHVYRVSPSQAARTPLAAARRLCHTATLMENKWVRRRATLMRRKEDVSVIRMEKRKYAFTNEQRKQVTDLLTTAMLEISEGIDKRSGHFYTKLNSMFEVVLPPSAEETMTFVKAPIMFNAKAFVKERDFNALMHRVHDLDPGLKRIERGFFICRSIPLVGFKVKLDKPKRVVNATKLLSEKFDRKVNLLDNLLVHHSSKLFWYAYDFPLETETMHFADQQVVENYGEYGQTSLLELDNGKLSRDEFVRLREDARRREVSIKTINLKSMRQQFEQKHAEDYKSIRELEDAAQEISEIMSRMRIAFSQLTATIIADDGKSNGLSISQYRKLYYHTKKMYKTLAGHIPEERDRLRRQLFEDRLRAREMYYEYRDLATRRSQFVERVTFLRGQVEYMRDLTRGSGKNLQIQTDLSA